MFEHQILLSVIYMVLYIGFIHFILVGNIVLTAILLLLTPKFYENIKWMVTLSMALGDIVLAGFSLVLETMHTFQYDRHLPLGLYIVYKVYMNFMIHFVYGAGLIILAVNFLSKNFFRNIFRNFFQERNLKSFLAIGLGALPWILGLSIILPLGLTDVDYRRLQINSHHLEALYIVSVILPALCTLILTIIIIRQRLPLSRLTSSPSQENLVPPSTDSEPTSPPDTAPVSVAVSPDEVICVLDPTTEVHNIVHPVQCGNVLQGGADHHSPDADQFRSPVVNNDAPVSANKQDLVINQLPTVQDGVISDQHPTVQPIMRRHQPLNIQRYNDTRSLHLTGHISNNSPPTPSPSSFNERRVLIIISLLYIIMVSPNAVFMLIVHNINPIDNTTFVVFSEIFFWLMIARSIVTPIVMSIHCVKS